jgi:tetratricopeptide (TPR) repeat protein
MAILFFSIIILCCSLNTYQRNSVWEEGTAIWSDCVLKSSYKVRPHTNLAAIYIEKGMLDRATSECKKALAINPDLAKPHYNLSITYYYKENYKLAIVHCDRLVGLGVSINPKLLELLKPYR